MRSSSAPAMDDCADLLQYVLSASARVDLTEAAQAAVADTVAASLRAVASALTADSLPRAGQLKAVQFSAKVCECCSGASCAAAEALGGSPAARAGAVSHARSLAALAVSGRLLKLARTRGLDGPSTVEAVRTSVPDVLSLLSGFRAAERGAAAQHASSGKQVWWTACGVVGEARQTGGGSSVTTTQQATYALRRLARDGCVDVSSFVCPGAPPLFDALAGDGASESYSREVVDAYNAQRAATLAGDVPWALELGLLAAELGVHSGSLRDDASLTVLQQLNDARS